MKFQFLLNFFSFSLLQLTFSLQNMQCRIIKFNFMKFSSFFSFVFTLYSLPNQTKQEKKKRTKTHRNNKSVDEFLHCASCSKFINSQNEPKTNKRNERRNKKKTKNYSKQERKRKLKKKIDIFVSFKVFIITIFLFILAKKWSEKTLRETIETVS